LRQCRISRGEPPVGRLFWCQFFSAFNDNFLKNALVFLILFKIGGQDAEALITLAGAVFIAPFFFLSGLDGQLSAVATVPDVRKGAKLVLITQKPGAKRSDFQAFAKSKGAAELMIPAEIHVVESAGAGFRQA
jgi:hypothetical protein